MSLPSDIRTERTLCFLISDDYVLLAKKKSGTFGSDKYNGFGGKKKYDETILQCAVRETWEENSIIIEESDLEQRAIIDFYFPAKPEDNQRVYVYFVYSWIGNPKGSSEMDAAEQFPLNNLPYDKMWRSDAIWLKELIAGIDIQKKLYGIFYWNNDNRTVEHYELKDSDLKNV